MAGVPSALSPATFAAAVPPAVSAYFLDVDGTLLEIRPRPEDVRADAALLGVIERITAAAGGALALVSGRAIDDLDRIFAPLKLPAAGLHGAEIRFAGGTRSFASAELVEEARPKLRAFAERYDGLRLEDKGATLALHFRQRPDLAAETERFVASLATRPELSAQRGKMVVELKASAHTKASGVAQLMAEAPYAGRRPVFVGDDLTDEHGFEWVNGNGGVSVRIAATPTPSAARFSLANPAELRAALAALEGVGENAGSCGPSSAR